MIHVYCIYTQNLPDPPAHAQLPIVPMVPIVPQSAPMVSVTDVSVKL